MSYRKNPAPENKQKFKSAVSRNKTVQKAVANAEKTRKVDCGSAGYIENQASKNKEKTGIWEYLNIPQLPLGGNEPLLSGVAILTTIPLTQNNARSKAEATALQEVIISGVIGTGALLEIFNNFVGIHQSSNAQVQNEEGVKDGSKGDSKANDSDDYYKKGRPEGGNPREDSLVRKDKADVKSEDFKEFLEQKAQNTSK